LDVPTLKHSKEMCIKNPLAHKIAFVVEISYADEKSVHEQSSINLIL
jgi:hypothetical protein